MLRHQYQPLVMPNRADNVFYRPFSVLASISIANIIDHYSYQPALSFTSIVERYGRCNKRYALLFA